MSRVHRSAWLAHPRVQIGLILALLVLIGALAFPAVGFVRGSWHWRKAQAAIAARDFRTAQAHLEACRRAWPDSAETAFLAARTARRAGDYRTAAAALRDAQRLEWVPQEIDVEQTLLEVQQGRDYTPTVGFLLNCIRRDHPDSLLILEVLEPAALRAADLPVVQECLDQWTKKDPADPRPHLDRGDLYTRFSRRNDALAEFRLAVERAPDNAEARLRLGTLQVELKMLDQAAAQFDWLAQRDPENPAVRLGLARCRYAAGRKDEAAAILDKLLQEQPGDGGALALRGVIDLDSGRAADAERWLREAARHPPTDVEVLFNLERSLTAQGKVDEAEKTKELRVATEAALAEIAKLMNQITTNPGDAELLRRVAALMMDNGLEAEGKRWLELAIRRDPRHSKSYITMAEYYERVGDFPAAKTCRDRAKLLAAQPK